MKVWKCTIRDGNKWKYKLFYFIVYSFSLYLKIGNKKKYKKGFYKLKKWNFLKHLYFHLKPTHSPTKYNYLKVHFWNSNKVYMEIRAFNTRKKWNNASKKGFLKSKLFQLNLSAFGVEKLLMFKKSFSINFCFSMLIQ